MGPGGGSLEKRYQTAYAFGLPFLVAGAGLAVMGSAYAAPLVVPPAVKATERLAVFGFAQATRPHWWVAYNAYKESRDLYHWSHGDSMTLEPDIRMRPYMLPTGVLVAVPFPWLNLRASHPEVAGLETSQPPPHLHQGNRPHRPQGQPVSVVVPAASPSAHGGGRSGAKPRCPYRFNRFRHYWARGLRSGARCVKSAGHSGPHRKG